MLGEPERKFAYQGALCRCNKAKYIEKGQRGDADLQPGAAQMLNTIDSLSFYSLIVIFCFSSLRIFFFLSLEIHLIFLHINLVNIV